MSLKHLFARRSFVHRSLVQRRLLTTIVAAGASLTLAVGCASSPTPATPSTSSSSSTSVSSTAQSPASSSASSVETSSEAVAESSPTASVADAFPVTVTTGNGDVIVAAKPVSIASLSPTATEMLYAIGAGDQVKVVDNYSDYPASLPSARVDAYQLNIEALTAYKPDLVVTVGVSPDQEAKFKALGMTVITETAPADLNGAFAQITQLGKVTGHTAEADALVAKLQVRVAAITAQKPVTTRPLTYYYELDKTYYSVTSDTFVGSVLADLGLVSIADTAKGAAAAGGYPQLDAEFILKANPDYIFLADTIGGGQTVASVAARDGWSALSAVADGRVVGLNDNIASRWGPRIVDLLDTILKAMKEHPVS